MAGLLGEEGEGQVGFKPTTRQYHLGKADGLCHSLYYPWVTGCKNKTGPVWFPDHVNQASPSLQVPENLSAAAEFPEAGQNLRQNPLYFLVVKFQQKVIDMTTVTIDDFMLVSAQLCDTRAVPGAAQQLGL
ncbi:hypothetical protein SLEP1_g11344 [Rubroshorea leprosula]|uniref:Uncharacterized protein n=1 Tax=Rubroshorea leprosula TaxID=152421 RepID=A0AAV5IGT6_9ROSI|nr:hypothetical protein SLEP1_g11344 [Rubroshorea leprosula]